MKHKNQNKQEGKIFPEVRKIIRKTPTKILLLLGIRENGYYSSQSLLARELKIPITTVNYHITKMKGEGLLQTQKTRKYPIILTQKGINKFKYLWNNIDTTTLRCHNVQIVFEVINSNKVYDDLVSVYEPFTNNKYRGLKTTLKNCKVIYYYPNKIVATIPDIYANNDEEIGSAISLQLPILKEIIEKEFEVKLGKHKLATIQRMHIAVLNSNIAKAHKLNGYTEENTLFAIDNSHNVPEVEITDPKRALQKITSLLELDKKTKLEEKNGDN